MINPEGYSYARYAYLVGEHTTFSNRHSASGISEEEHNENVAAAEAIANASERIISENGLEESWNKENYENFKTMFRCYLSENPNFRFDVGAIRAIPDEDLKNAMYDILEKPESVTRQFESSGLKEGDKFTLIHFGGFGGLNCMNATFKLWEKKRYAQYEDNIHMVFKPVGKRNFYESNLHGDFLIYPGYVSIPDNVLWETVKSESGTTIRKTRFLSCDSAALDAVIDNFKSEGIKPIINTYRPVLQ